MSVVSVRQLDPSEWETLRTLRLRSLVESPTAFVSTAEREQVFDDEHWRARTERTVVALRGAEAVGLAAWHRSEDEFHAELVGMWVDPDERGTKTARRLVEFVQDRMASEHRTLELGVHPDNARAIRFYKKCGFLLVGEETGAVTGRTLLCMRLPS